MKYLYSFRITSLKKALPKSLKKIPASTLGIAKRRNQLTNQPKEKGNFERGLANGKG
ncbi:hypothetical protein AB1K18_27680 [Peribacillus simplex]|uniref:hypothetical protein n=1 Tax=Peribacillus simplex TaxID=1478 RepID=UPI003B8DD5F2